MKNYHEPSAIISKEQIDRLSDIFDKCWTIETASPKSKLNWSEQNKALGQCAVTALVVNDMFGGDIIEQESSNHIWNILPDGTQHDFTRMQFPTETDFKNATLCDRDKILNSKKAKTLETLERYHLLKKRVDKLRLELGW